MGRMEVQHLFPCHGLCKMKELGKALVDHANSLYGKTDQQAYKSSEKFKKSWKHKYGKLVQKEERSGTKRQEVIKKAEKFMIVLIKWRFSLKNEVQMDQKLSKMSKSPNEC